MATQHATPATHSKPCATEGLRPNGRLRSHRRCGVGRCQRHQRWALAHACGQQEHAYAAKNAQHDVGLTPADGLHPALHQWWPDRARDVIATGANGHRNAAAAVPPQSGVGHQGRKGGRAAHKTHQRMRQAKSPDAARQARPHKTAAHRQGAYPQHWHQPVPVGHAACEQTAQAQTDHHQGVRQRRIGPAHAKLGLHLWQHHRDDVHAAVAQHHQPQRDEQAPRGLAGIDEGRVGGQGVHRPNLADEKGRTCLVGYCRILGLSLRLSGADGLGGFKQTCAKPLALCQFRVKEQWQ